MAKTPAPIQRAANDEADAQIRQLQKEIDYDLKDYPIDYIIEKFKRDFFYIPPYQREYIWPESYKNKFIESILLGLPIPFMFVAEVDDGRIEIIDGAQRIQTLEQFMNDDLVLKNLNKLTKLENYKFSNLPDSQQKKFGNRALRLIFLKEMTTLDIRTSEIRKGSYVGPLLDFIKECSEAPLFRKLCPTSEMLIKRREPEELITRFFALSDGYTTFKHDVDDFLNAYVTKHRHTFDRQSMRSEFLRMLDFVENNFSSGFAKSIKATSTPRVRFESIAVGVNLALRIKPDLRKINSNWIDSPEFIFHTTTHASNSKKRVRERIEFVRDHVLAG